MNALTDNTNLPCKATSSVDSTRRLDRYWVAVREGGKLARLNFTDAVLEFSNYQDQFGGKSTRPDLAFSNFTRSIYRPLGLNSKKAKEIIEGRNDMDLLLLDTLRMTESATAQLLKKGMKAGMKRGEIKLAFKRLVDRMADQYVELESDHFEVIQ